MLITFAATAASAARVHEMATAPATQNESALARAIDVVQGTTFAGAPDPVSMRGVARVWVDAGDRVHADGGQSEVAIQMQALEYIGEGGATCIDGLPESDASPPSALGRAQQLVERCQQALSSPAANLLSVTARTGLIVTLSVALRETITYYVQQGLDNHAVSEANRSYATAGVVALGASLNLIGLAREHLNGSENLQTRLGRLGMLGLTLASGLAAGLQGGLGAMTASTVGTTVYSLVRDVANTFFPLQHNVSEFNALPTAAAAGFFGLFGGMLEYLAPYLPSGGELGAGFSLDMLWNSLSTALNAVQDDATLLALNYHAAPPLADSGFRVRTQLHLPSIDDVIAAVTTVAPLRMGAIHSINFAVAAVLSATSDGNEPHPQAHLIGTSMVAVMLAVIYGPFVAGTLSTPVSSDPVRLSENRATIESID